jgi:6-pyruvoyltetrahydropterin/6-carboxytetrahydropterin synthase
VTTTIEIGCEAAFSAAHASLHDGLFEPLHGHTFGVMLRLTGDADAATGMLVDFHTVKKALREVIEPLRRRTLMPAAGERLSIRREGESVHILGGGKRYVLPASDVLVLPVPNTTTEQIADYLLGQLLSVLGEQPRLRAAELTVAEAPDTAATASRVLHTRLTWGIPGHE